MTALAWTVLVASVVMAAVLSGLETGVYVLNKARMDLLAEQQDKSARTLRRLLANPDSLLAVLLVSYNVANYAATFAMTALFLMAGCGERSEWYTLAVATPVLFIFADSIPKNIFQRHAEKAVYRLAWLLAGCSAVFNAVGLAPLMRAFSRLVVRAVAPQRRVYSLFAHESVMAIVAEGQAAGALTHSQSVMADRVMRLASVRLGDVMIPMRKVVGVSGEVTRAKLMDILRDHNFSRIPVTDAGGQIVGVLDLYEALLASQGDAQLPTPAKPFKLTYAMTVPDALYHMQREHESMAVVCADDGRHIGIATIKDLVEEIVGELEAW